jgi:purine nucleosidase
MATKILLDTDIGSDIDDAVCLAYLLAQPECDLLGITTVTGEVVKRAMLASALCKVAKKEVPIYPGCENPILVSQLQPHAPQADALDRWEHERDFPEGEAVEFLRRTIRKNPGEVILLTIGPLTNIGLLFTLDPEIPRLLKGLVMMCGVFTNRFDMQGQAEWNARLDPHATEIVYRTPVAAHRSIGLDVTLQTVLKAEEVRRRFQVPLLRPVLDFAEVWFKNTENMVFHDPLAATTLFDDSICGFERGSVRTEAVIEPGHTHWTTDPQGDQEAAMTVNPAHFFDHYFGILGA